MENIRLIKEYARDVEDHFLGEVANGRVQDFSMDINYDDREIDVYYFPNRPLKFIKVNVIVNKSTGL